MTRGFYGTLSVSPDGGVDGWCGDPARPGLRCWVEILAEDRLVATVLARDPCDGLSARGFVDDRHGFRARLALAGLPARPDLLVWARVGGERRGFAQCLLTRPGVPEPIEPREAAVATRVAQLSDRLVALVGQPKQREAAMVREAVGADLPFFRAPGTTLVVPRGLDLGAVRRLIFWLVPLARELGAEVLVLTGDDERALLPSLVPNLRLGSDWRQARAERVVLLDPDDPAPSLVVLEHVLCHGPPVVFGPAAPPGLRGWRLPASPGVRAVLPRGALTEGDDWPALLAGVRAAGLDAMRVELR